MKHIYILIGAVIAVVIAILFVHTPHAIVAPQPVSVSLPTSSGVGTPTRSVGTTSTTSVPKKTATMSIAHATFKVNDKTYSVNVTPDETVMGAMRTLASTTDFRYTSRDYPGLGEFVDSINGIKNTAGLYWILSINGVSATSGASAIAVHVNDVIEWKYEKNY